MTTTTRNEAAERPVLVAMTPELVEMLSRNGWDFGERGPDGFHTPSVRIGEQHREALAAERRATVERIQQAVLFQRNRLGKPSEQIRVTDLLAILDEEASR